MGEEEFITIISATAAIHKTHENLAGGENAEIPSGENEAQRRKAFE
jgi:hypothetical protein